MRQRSNSEPTPAASLPPTPTGRTPRRAKTAARQEIANTYARNSNIGHQHDGPISLPPSRETTPPRQRLLSTHDTPILSSHQNFDFESENDHLEWDAHIDWDDILPYDTVGTVWDNISVGSPSEINDLNRVYKMDRLLDKYWKDHPPDSQ